MTDSPAAAALFDFPSRPEDRLRLALRRLDAAVLAQAEAVAEWRAELGRLGMAVQGLDGSMTGLRQGLDGAAEALRQAETEVRRLDRTADAMLSMAAKGPQAPAARRAEQPAG